MQCRRLRKLALRGLKIGEVEEALRHVGMALAERLLADRERAA